MILNEFKRLRALKLFIDSRCESESVTIDTRFLAHMIDEIESELFLFSRWTAFEYGLDFDMDGYRWPVERQYEIERVLNLCTTEGAA